MSDSAGATIQINELRKTFRPNWRAQSHILALQGVTFDVTAGSIFGLLGPNGAGKTTLIKVLLGLVRPTSGWATLFGRPVGERAIRQRIGYLPEHHRIPRHHTGRSALQYYGGLNGLSPSEVRRREPALLQQVGLAGWQHTSVRKYSKGMLQRLGLAQAMLHDPDLLVLDEPTDGVDPVGRREMREILRQLKDRGKTVFINSHLLQEVELVCDRAAVLVKGKLRRVGPVEELTQLSDPDVEFTVRAEEQAVRACLQSLPLSLAKESLVCQSPPTFRFVLTRPQASDSTRCLDALRLRGIEIVSMIPQRHSLEDAFLSIVTDGDQQDAAERDAES